MAKDSGTIEFLNQILKLEYSLIIYYPRLASSISDPEIKDLVLKLGKYSIRHADTVANAIGQLGGQAAWSFETFPDLDDMGRIFRNQLEKERQALELHKKAAGLTTAPALRDKFAQMAKEEAEHIKLVQSILSRLGEKETV